MTRSAHSPKDKADLVALLNVDMGMARGTMSALSAIEYCVESFVRSTRAKTNRCWSCRA